MAHEYFLHTKTSERWKKIGTKKRAGVAVPLFSLYSGRVWESVKFPTLNCWLTGAKKRE